MGDVQVQVLAKALVLGCEIDAGYCKTQVKIPGNGGAETDGTRSVLVVYGKADPTAKGLKLTELVEQCKTMVDFFNDDADAKKSIMEALPPQAVKYLNSIEFKLKEVFFIKPLDEPAEGGAPGAKGNAVSSEFAFWFDINFQDMTKGWPVEVKSVSLKLWKTTNAKILEEMKVSSMMELLDFGKKTMPTAPAAP